MQREDFKRFGMALTACAELYGKTVSEGALSLWWEALKRFDIEQVEKAIRQCIESPEGGQFMPKPADLIKRLEGTATDRSLIAWGKVFGAMSSVGAYRSVAFDDGLIHAAVQDCGGWVKLCRSETDELPFVQRRFCDAYRAYSQRPEFPYPAVLVGESEQQNMALGRAVKVPPPTLIGDESKAKAIALSGGRQLAISGTVGANVLRLAASVGRAEDAA